MSIQAMSMIFGRGGVDPRPPHPSKGADRLVLLALANHASDDDYSCWPSIETITREAGLSRPEATRVVLKRLEEAGWIVRSVNAGPDSRVGAGRRTNLYRIVPHPPLGTGGVDEGRSFDPPRGTGGHPPLETGGHPPRPTGGHPPRGKGGESSLEPSVEPSVEPSPTKTTRESQVLTDFAQSEERVAEEAEVRARTRDENAKNAKNEIALPDDDDNFEDFWRRYPRKVGKAEARKAYSRAYKALAAESDPDPHATLLRACTAYAAARASQDERYTKHAASWLNAERWRDDPPPAARSSIMSQFDEALAQLEAEEAAAHGPPPDDDEYADAEVVA